MVKSFVWSAGSDGLVKEWNMTGEKRQCLRQMAPPGSEKGLEPQELDAVEWFVDASEVSMPCSPWAMTFGFVVIILRSTCSRNATWHRPPQRTGINPTSPT